MNLDINFRDPSCIIQFNIEFRNRSRAISEAAEKLREHLRQIDSSHNAKSILYLNEYHLGSKMLSLTYEIMSLKSDESQEDNEQKLGQTRQEIDE